MAKELGEDERATIEFVLSELPEGESRDALLAQLQSATGEPIPEDPISLRLTSEAPPSAMDTAHLDAEGVDDSGIEVSVLLRIRRGRLHELEFYVMGDEMTYGRPRVETLRRKCWGTPPPRLQRSD